MIIPRNEKVYILMFLHETYCDIIAVYRNKEDAETRLQNWVASFSGAQNSTGLVILEKDLIDVKDSI